MGMYATSANQLTVDFGGGRSVTFRMHADVGVDLVRWLRGQLIRLEVANKRAAKVEKAAVDLSSDKIDAQLDQLISNVGVERQRGDEIPMITEYIKRGSKGWTDFYEDADAEARGELLPFTSENIVRLGVMNMIKVLNTFNEHYGLAASDQTPGEAKGESLPALSPSRAEVESLPNGIASSAPTAP